MAGLMDMRELGMLRNATQRMWSGGGIDMDEWRRRRKIPVIEATIDMDEWRRRKAAAIKRHHAYQALKRGASGGPFAVGTTPLTEEERLALWMQAQRNAEVENPQQFFPEYTGEADPGLENVHPELLLGGVGTLTARGAMKAAPALWRLGRRAIKHTDPVTGSRVVRPGIQRALAGIRKSIVRPSHAGGTRGPITRGVNASGKPTISRGPTSTPYGPRMGPLGYAIGGAGLGYAANKEEVDNMVSGLFSGTPEEQVTTPEETVAPTSESVTYPEVEHGEVTPLPGGHYTGVPMHDDPSSLKTIIDSPKREKEPLPAPQNPQNKSYETPKNTPNLWKTWGSLADDPKKRRDAYLGSLKNIYMKKMLLDSIAKLTGGKSQGDAWAQMAIAELDAMEKFDSEERIHQQWKALFFREDGTYDPPKDRKEAMERGQQLGYDADQMKDIMTVFPKETDDRPTLQKNISFILAMEDGPMKWSLMKEHGLIKTDDLTAAERSADRAVRDNIITEEEKGAYIRSIFVPKDTSRTKGGVTTEQFNIWQAMPEGTEEEKELKRVYRNMISADRGRITAGQAADLLTASAEGRLTLNAAQLTALKKIFDAGLGIKTPTVSDRDRAQQLKAEGTTREEYAQMVRKKHSKASDTAIEETVQALYD